MKYLTGAVFLSRESLRPVEVFPFCCVLLKIVGVCSVCLGFFLCLFVRFLGGGCLLVFCLFCFFVVFLYLGGVLLPHFLLCPFVSALSLCLLYF